MGDFLNELLGLNLVPSSKPQQDEADQEIQIDTTKETKKKPQTRFSFYNPFALVKSQPQENEEESQPRSQVTEEEQFEDAISTTNDDDEEPEERLNIDISSDENDSLNDSTFTAELESIERRQDQITPEHAAATSFLSDEEKKDESFNSNSQATSSQPEQQLSTSTWLERRSPFFTTMSSASVTTTSSRPPSSLAGDLEVENNEDEPSEEDSETQYDTAEESSTTGGGAGGPLHSPSDHDPSSSELDSLTNFAKALLMEEEEQDDAQKYDVAKVPPATSLADQHVSNQSERIDRTPARSNKSMAVRPEAPLVPTIDRTPQSQQPHVDEASELAAHSNDPEIPSTPDPLSPIELRKSPPATTSSLARASPTHEEVFNTPKSLREMTSSPLNHSSLTKPQALLFDQDIPKLPDPTAEQAIDMADDGNSMQEQEQQQLPLASPPLSPISVRPESPNPTNDGVSVDDTSAETETINNTSRNQPDQIETKSLGGPSEFSLLMQEELDLSREVKEAPQHSITETGQALDLMMNGDNDKGMDHNVYTGPDDNLLDLSTQIDADFAAILHDQEAAEIASEFAAILGPTNSAESVFPLLKGNGQDDADDANEEEFADSPVFQLLDDEIGSEFQAILSDDASKSNQVESDQPVPENGVSSKTKSDEMNSGDLETHVELSVGPLEASKSDPAAKSDLEETAIATAGTDPPEISSSTENPMATQALDPPGDESSVVKDERLTESAPQSSQEHDDATHLPNSIIPSSADTVSSALTDELPKVSQETATSTAHSPSRKRPSSMNIEFQPKQRARRRASSSMELYLAASSESSVASNHSTGSSSRHVRRPSLELIPKGIASEQSHKIGDAFGAATPLKAKALQKRRESELLLLQELGIATEGTNIMEETKQYRQIMDNEHLSEDQRKQELLKLLELGKAKANSVMMETRRKSFQSESDVPSLDEIKKSRSVSSSKQADHQSLNQRLCLSESDAQRTTLSVDVSSAPMFPQIITEVSVEQDAVEDESRSRQPLPIQLLALDELTLSKGYSVNSDSAVDHDLLVDLTNHRTGTVQRRRQTSPSIRVGNPVFFADQCELIELPEEHQMALDPLGEQLCQLLVDISDRNKAYPSLSSLLEAELVPLGSTQSSTLSLVNLTSRNAAHISTKQPFQLINIIIPKDEKEQLTTSGKQKLSVDTGVVEMEVDQVDNHDEPPMMLPLVSLSSVTSRSTPTREFEQLKNDDTTFREVSEQNKPSRKELSVNTTAEVALVNLSSVSPNQMRTEQSSPTMGLLQIPVEQQSEQPTKQSINDMNDPMDSNHHLPLVSLGSVTPRSTPTRAFALLQDEETTFSEGVNAKPREEHVNSEQNIDLKQESPQHHHVDLVTLQSSRPRTIKSKAMPILDDPITMTMSSFHVAKSQAISPVWKQIGSMSDDTNDDAEEHQLDEEVVGFYRSVSVKDLRRSMSQLRITYPDTEEEDDDHDDDSHANDVLVIEPDTKEVEEQSHELRLVPSPSELSELSSSQSVATSMLNRSSIWKTRVSKIRERRLQDSLRSLSAHQSGHVPPPPTPPFNSPTLVGKPKLQLAPGVPSAFGRDEDEDALAKVATKSKLPSRSRSMSDGEYSEFDELHHDEDDVWVASATPSGTTTRSTTPFSSEVMAATSASLVVPNETTTTQENNNNNNPAVLFETAGDFSAFHQAVQSFQDQPHGADRMERLNERRRASMEQEQSSEQQQQHQEVTRSSGQKPPRPSPLNLPSLTPPPPPLLSATPPPILTSSLTMSTPSSAPLPNMTVHLFDTPTVQKWKQRASFAREKSQKRLSATPRPNEVTTTTLPTIPGATVLSTGAMLVASESKSFPIATNIGVEVPLLVKAATEQLQQQCVTDNDDTTEWNVILSLQTSVTTDCYEGQRTVTVTVTGTPAQVQHD